MTDAVSIESKGTNRTILGFCHFCYALHLVVAFAFARDLILMATSRGHKIDGIPVAAAIMLFCLLTGYAVRFTAHRSKPAQIEPWLLDHLRSQGRTFWITFALFLPIFILMGLALLLSLFALLFRSIRGWVALAKGRPLYSNSTPMPNPSVNKDAAR